MTAATPQPCSACAAARSAGRAARVYYSPQCTNATSGERAVMRDRLCSSAVLFATGFRRVGVGADEIDRDDADAAKVEGLHVEQWRDAGPRQDRDGLPQAVAAE